MIDPFLRKNTPSETNTPIASTTPQSSQNPQKVASPVGQKVPPKSSSFSIKTILFGCLGFTVVFVGLAALVLYMMVQNPDQYATLGLDRATIQILLQTFALLFFGTIFFVGFGLLLVNGYKFITVKNKPKITHLLLSIVGFVVLLISIVLGATVLNNIGQLQVNRGIDTASLVVPYMVLHNGPTNILTNPDLSLIAPASMVFQLNGTVFNRQVAPSLGLVDIQSIVMTCGNGTNLSLNMNTLQFDGSCYYFSKGEYPIVLTVTHVHRQTTETMTNVYEVGALQFVSEIAMSIQDGSFDRGAGELIAGKAPRKITWDASAVFRDLGLPEYRIVWDVDGDDQTDAENVSDITWIYNEPKLYNLVVRFPGLNTFAYTFPFRIEQPDVPICILSVTQTQGTTYSIQAQMTGRQARIDGYNFSILDISNARSVVGSQRATSNVISYNFPGQGLYAVKLDFVTSDGRQGSCESNNIAVGQADFTIDYGVRYKSPTEPNFLQVDASTPVSLQGSSILVQELPTILQIRIAGIQPASPTADVSVFFDDVAILSADDRVFEMRVNDRQGGTIVIVVDDPSRNAKTSYRLPVVVQQAPIVGRLTVRPDTVGTDPFTVTFDASTTVLQDPLDEIVYFSWDFGDGVVKPNVSQSVITHTYQYNYTTENGIYSPLVEIFTKKGLSLIVRPSDAIIVKKVVDDVVVRIDSHPAQLARVGDTVEFSLAISGLPDYIVWDFGDGSIVELPGRQGINVSHVFTENKNYTIKASISYENQPTLVGTIVLRVQ